MSKTDADRMTDILKAKGKIYEMLQECGIFESLTAMGEVITDIRTKEIHAGRGTEQIDDIIFKIIGE